MSDNNDIRNETQDPKAAQGALVPMLAYGGGALFIGMAVTKTILAKVGQLDMMVVMAAGFGPIWVGGLIGWAVAYAAAKWQEKSFWVSPLVAALIALPAAYLDPWQIVSLGLFNKVAVDVLAFEPAVATLLGAALFMLPVVLAACFAAMGLTVRAAAVGGNGDGAPRLSIMRIIIGVVLLAVIHQAVNTMIYGYFLPPRNL